jgi:hypothetical protein
MMMVDNTWIDSNAISRSDIKLVKWDGRKWIYAITAAIKNVKPRAVFVNLSKPHPVSMTSAFVRLMYFIAYPVNANGGLMELNFFVTVSIRVGSYPNVQYILKNRLNNNK